MILRSLVLENFGLYGGRTAFDLTPTPGPSGPRPVVLVGGRNGAGKTTFLEAVRLALYGQRALGSRIGRAEYEAYLAGRIHRTLGPGPHLPGAVATTAVELAFDYAEAGVVHRYTVRREWRAGGRESLRLEKDGRPVDAVPRDEWHGFLQELVPPGVSQLFFFDGEKIQEMADAGDDASSLVEAVRGLLGIETVARLRTDLGFFIARHRRREAEGTGADLETVERELAALSRQVEAAVGEEAELVTAKETRARVLEQARRRFVQEGGEVAERRGGLEAERDRVRHRVTAVETELRELANGLLPFAVAPRLMARFEAAIEGRLRAAAGTARGKGEIAGLAAAVAAWRASPTPPRSARWTEGHWRDLAAFAEGLAGAEIDEVAGEAPGLDAVGDLPGLRDRLVQARTALRERAGALAEELDCLGEELRETEGLLERADSFAASAALLVAEVEAAERGHAEAETALGAASESLRALRYRAEALEKRRLRLLEDGEAAAMQDRRTALAGRVGEALAVYERRLVARKVARLEEEFVRAFRHLARKEDLVERVTVDPGTFQVRLVARGGREVAAASLSAGERQIFAVAMLWALGRVSGRPLPVIVDTPLARLDGEHRDRLVDRYFPAASHQVIVLSTDEEIQGRLLRRLRPSVSHSYRLDYDPAQGRTLLRPGYFDGAGVEPPSEEEGAVRAIRQA